MIAYKAVVKVDDGVYQTPFNKTYGFTGLWYLGQNYNAEGVAMMEKLEDLIDWLDYGSIYGYDTILKCEVNATGAYHPNTGNFHTELPEHTIIATDFIILGEVD